MENWQFHEEMKQLNIQSYKFDTFKEGMSIKGNVLKWKVEGIHYDPTTNAKAVAYSNGENLTFSYLGTDPTNKLDWQNNSQILRGQIPNQFASSEKFYLNTIKKYKGDNPQTQYIEDGQIRDIPRNWQEYLNTPKDFSKLQPSKLDELKNPTVAGVGIIQSF